MLSTELSPFVPSQGAAFDCCSLSLHGAEEVVFKTRQVDLIGRFRALRARFRSFQVSWRRKLLQLRRLYLVRGPLLAKLRVDRGQAVTKLLRREADVEGESFKYLALNLIKVGQ